MEKGKKVTSLMQYHGIKNRKIIIFSILVLFSVLGLSSMSFAQKNIIQDLNNVKNGIQKYYEENYMLQGDVKWNQYSSWERSYESFCISMARKDYFSAGGSIQRTLYAYQNQNNLDNESRYRDLQYLLLVEETGIYQLMKGYYGLSYAHLAQAAYYRDKYKLDKEHNRRVQKILALIEDYIKAYEPDERNKANMMMKNMKIPVSI